MSEVTFINNEIANPLYKEDQKKVLDNIKTHPYEQILEQEFCDLVKSNSELIGEKIIKINDDCYFAVHRNRNNILTIKKNTHLNLNYPKNEGGLKRKFIAEVAPKIDLIDEYFIIDMKSGMAFDASILWRTKSSTRFIYREGDTEALSIPNRKIIGTFGPNMDGGDLIINTLNDKRAATINPRGELSQDQIDLLNNVTLFHESGHKFQLDQYAHKLNQDPKFTFLAALTKFPFVKNFYSKETISSLERLKTTVSEQERNAVAFSLAVIRKLKESDLDLARGLSNDQVCEAVNLGLKTYEEEFRKIDGPKIAQPKKKNYSDLK